MSIGGFMLNRKTIECDFCVIGGGIAGMCAAISAAREGAKVVLMHERAVLGGNASSEIRMWICGARGENNRETGILEEINLENAYRNPTKSFAVWDTVLYEIVINEKNITLLLNCTCMDAKYTKGEFSHGRNIRIDEVTGYQMTTQCFFDVSAKMYSDCSGDSILAPLCEAEFRLGREGRDEFGENTQVDIADNMTMGMSCLIGAHETEKNIKFIPPSFSTKLTKENFENRNPNIYADNENFWYLELGGNRDTIGDTEELRDELIALATGTWDHIKNSGEHDADKWDLDFLGFLPGKRESRRMVGEYMITERDISNNRVFNDEVAYGGWPLDDHFPGGFYHKGTPNTNYLPHSPYSIPYRALYSKNVENLFFAGRNISMTHTAMSSIRVMATCALLGEAVGRGAYLAAKYNTTPHGVYLNHLEELQDSLLRGDCFLPSKKRKISKACLDATLNAPDILRNGEDRPHKLYGKSETESIYLAKEGEEIRYRFEKLKINEIHITFDSDLNRVTLEGSDCERTHGTRPLTKLTSPEYHIPTTLCKSFTLIGELDGNATEILHIYENRKRAYNIPISMELDSITLIPLEGRNDSGKVGIISFDFT